MAYWLQDCPTGLGANKLHQRSRVTSRACPDFSVVLECMRAKGLCWIRGWKHVVDVKKLVIAFIFNYPIVFLQQVLSNSQSVSQIGFTTRNAMLVRLQKRYVPKGKVHINKQVSYAAQKCKRFLSVTGTQEICWTSSCIC